MFKSQIGGLALNRRNGPKWVQNRRQVMRIDPRACRGHFLASGTGPAAQNPPKYSPNSRSTAPGGRYWYQRNSRHVLGRGMTARQPQMLQMSAVETRQMSALATEDMSAVETGPMSAAETGQMSAVETRQMSSVARTDICLVSTHNVDVSEVSIVAISQCSSLR